MNITRTCLILSTTLMVVSPATLVAQPRTTEKPVKYAIAVHGGAGSWSNHLTDEERTEYQTSLKQAVTIGKQVLERGGSSLDAVEQVIGFLEDDPKFNAGRGAVFNAQGRHELDASIMDGRTKACGAVGGVKTVKNPISLARLVMTQTRHVLLVGDGAEAFADQMQVQRVQPEYFDTQKQRESYQRARASQPPPQSSEAGAAKHMGTVGCVALDQHGNLAAGTSTGGLTMKKYGRIGDSPIIGAGTYADNATCAVSCTGVGEEFIRHAIAHDVSARMQHGDQSLADAARTVIHETLAAGTGGLIAVDSAGRIVMEFNTPGMARAAADSSGRLQVELLRGE